MTATCPKCSIPWARRCAGQLDGQWSAADPDAQILALPWSNKPADRIVVFERLVQREIIEPRRKALEAMRRGFRTVEMVPQLTRALFPSSRRTRALHIGDDELSAESLWSLFTFDPEAYSQTLIEYDHTLEGYTWRTIRRCAI